MADENNKGIVLYADAMGNVRKVSVDGVELVVESASLLMQGGKVGVNVTVTGYSVRSEPLPDTSKA